VHQFQVYGVILRVARVYDESLEDVEFTDNLDLITTDSKFACLRVLVKLNWLCDQLDYALNYSDSLLQFLVELNEGNRLDSHGRCLLNVGLLRLLVLDILLQFFDAGNEGFDWSTADILILLGTFKVLSSWILIRHQLKNQADKVDWDTQNNDDWTECYKHYQVEEVDQKAIARQCEIEEHFKEAFDEPKGEHDDVCDCERTDNEQAERQVLHKGHKLVELLNWATELHNVEGIRDDHPNVSQHTRSRGDESTPNWVPLKQGDLFQ
jgi:hypothetical protein